MPTKCDTTQKLELILITTINMMNLSYFKSSLLFSLLCLIILSISAHAQTPTVNLRFVSFPKSANAESIELLIGEAKTIEVKIPTNSISEAYEVPALATWALGKSSTNEKDEYAFLTYGKAASIVAKEQLVIVVRQGPNDADGLTLTTLKNSDEGFSGGKYILLNAAKVDIAGSIGSGKFSLKPNGFSMIAPKPTKTEGDRSYCFTEFFFRKNEEVQPFFSATWRFNENARSMVFFYHDPKSKQLQVHTIRSFAP